MPEKDKAQSVRQLTDQEIEARLEVLREELFNLRFQTASHQNQNPKRIREVRRTIARIITIQSERKRKVS
jgi:large subunit ribosomal protein L29